MLIDLHCHTRKIKKGDSIKRNVTPQKFAEKIEQSNVKIVAITNHNHFDYPQCKNRIKQYLLSIYCSSVVFCFELWYYYANNWRTRGRGVHT